MAPSGLALALAIAFFPMFPRYGAFAYTLALIAAVPSLVAAGGRWSFARPAVAVALGLSACLALAIVGGKLWNRRDLLSGKQSRADYLAQRYPQGLTGGAAHA